MVANSSPKERLELLLDKAVAYTGLTKRQLGEMLGRDPGRIVPESGLPKIDLVVRLADLLDWPREAVLDVILPPEAQRDVGAEARDYTDLQTSSRTAWMEGRYADAVALARRAYGVACSADERALAANREVAAWNGLGHYTKALEALRRGLSETSASQELRLILESNMANAYYTGWELTEARAIATGLLLWYQDLPPTTQRDRATEAFSLYVRGNALRRMMITDEGHPWSHAARGRSDLETAALAYERLAEEFGDPSYTAIANTCRGGILEIDAALGRVDAEDALGELQAGLDNVVDPEACPPGDWLESYGWWCIFGCNIALRNLSDEQLLQRTMGVFTDKADHIAQRLDSWTFRERVFTMEYAREERVARFTGRQPRPLLDQSDVRVLIGTMGRFPLFRATGLRILELAVFVDEPR